MHIEVNFIIPVTMYMLSTLPMRPWPTDNFIRYCCDVHEDDIVDNGKAIAFMTASVPEGLDVDTTEGVYAGCGDGVQVHNPSSKLLDKT